MSKKKCTSFDGGPVGYRRPPVEHQFKKGERRGGRPRGSKNLSTVVDEILKQKVQITEDGKRRTVSTLQAIILKARAVALTGSTRDILAFLKIIERFSPDTLRRKPEPIPFKVIPGDLD